MKRRILIFLELALFAIGSFFLARAAYDSAQAPMRQQLQNSGGKK